MRDCNRVAGRFSDARNERPFKRNERPLSKSPIGGRACHTASQRPSLLPLPVPSLGSPYVGSGFGEVEAPNGVPQSGHISALLVFVTVFASWHLVQKKTIWSGQLIPPDAWSRSSSSSSIPLSEKQAASFSSSIMIESPPFRSHCGTFLFRNPLRTNARSNATNAAVGRLLWHVARERSASRDEVCYKVSSNDCLISRLRRSAMG